MQAQAVGAGASAAELQAWQDAAVFPKWGDGELGWDLMTVFSGRRVFFEKKCQKPIQREMT